MKHSETPWIVIRHIYFGAIIVNETCIHDEILAHVASYEDAQFVINCCNNYETMLQYLQNTVDYMELKKIKDPIKKDIQEYIESLKNHEKMDTKPSK